MKKLERPALLVLIGVSVFAIGASLVVLSLHSRSAGGSTADRRTAPPVTGTALKPAPQLNTSEVAIPPGDQAVAVTPATGTAALAGYLGPGDVVDVYATNKAVAVPAAAMPCATLVAAGVPVLDVSVQSPEYKGHVGVARSVPGTVTVLLAATAAQGPPLVFAALNEQVYLAEVPSGGTAPSTPCAGGAS